ncbi:MAG: DUF4433 domain-containing protein [Pirellulales bacterium]|nr:DUF4433 domain-containing protein [Pirellulales bacterium]
MSQLGPEKAHIFRITHVDNIPWILKHGLHCKNCAKSDPNFVPIGLPELIQKRIAHRVPIPPGGVLGDYIPFYFTPWSIMMYNIRTGYNGVIKRTNNEIAILVSSLHKLQRMDVPFIFTNAHAYMNESEYFDNLDKLERIDWQLLRNRDFKNDPEDPGKLGRYHAEALVHRHVPVEALSGIVCYDANSDAAIKAETEKLGRNVVVKILTGWYF